MKNSSKISQNKYYVFDLDGTLVDSMPACKRAFMAVAEEDGIAYSDDFVKKIIPLGFAGGAEYYINTYKLDTTPEIINERIGKRLYEEYRSRVYLKSGAKEYLTALKLNGAKLYVLTANSHTLADAALKNNGVYDIFDDVFSVEDFGVAKNTPKLFSALALKLGCNPCEINYFDDSIKALTSAKEAGAHTFGAYDAHTEAELAEMRNGICEYVVMSFSELLD